MKKTILSLLVFLTIQITNAQDNVAALFNDAQIIFEKELNTIPVEVFPFEGHTFITGAADGIHEDVLLILDKSGNQIAEKPLENTIYFPVTASRNGEFINLPTIISHPDECYYCIEFFAYTYDKKGNLISEIKTTTYHTELSPNGDYLITTKVEDVEQGGWFEAFDVKTGEKISLPAIGKYSHFHAAFINDTKVALVTHHFEIKFDTTQHRRSRKYRTSIELGDSLTILDLKSKTVDLKAKLKYSGTDFFSTQFDNKALWISPDGSKILIVGASKPQEEKSAREKYALIALSSKGELLWNKSFEQEENDFEGVEDMVFLDNNTAAVLKFGLIQSELKLINLEDGKENWNYQLGPKFSAQIKGFSVSKTDAAFAIDFSSSWEEYKLTMRFNREKPELLNTLEGKTILSKSMKYSAVKEGENSIKLVRNERNTN